MKTAVELAPRMELLVRRMAESGPLHYSTRVEPLFNEAVAIVAEMPPPIDSDLIEARELARRTALCGDGPWASEPLVSRYRSGELDEKRQSGIPLALAAIKRGRELASQS